MRQQKNISEDVKYCVCAMIDLLGFSNHLEISGYDLRTSIGEQAVKRLQNLETVLEMLESEKENRTEYYPQNFHSQRVNDAIFFTIDLDDILKPRVGAISFQGISSLMHEDIFSEDEMDSYEKYHEAYNMKIRNAIEPLIKFLGFISRIHILLNQVEAGAFFPGAKTVVSTGLRRRINRKTCGGDNFRHRFDKGGTGRI